LKNILVRIWGRKVNGGLSMLKKKEQQGPEKQAEPKMSRVMD